MNIGALLREVQETRMRKDVPDFRVGDTIRINIRIKEGDKTRVQPFEGIVISRKGSGLSANFAVRRISYSVGVEKTFPLHSPLWESIRVLRSSAVKRAKLKYFFRNPDRLMKFKSDPRRQAVAAPAEVSAEGPVRAVKAEASGVEAGAKKLSKEEVAKLKEKRAKKKGKRTSRRDLAVARASRPSAPGPAAAVAVAAAVAEKTEEKKA